MNEAEAWPPESILEEALKAAPALKPDEGNPRQPDECVSQPVPAAHRGATNQ
jgi:hypothetical protein